MKVVHLSVMRQLSHGQRKQLAQERLAAAAVDVDWSTLAVHNGSPGSEFERQVPPLMRLPGLRFIYSWLTAIKLSREYDFVLMRHAPFDIVGALLSGRLKNRVSVHHSREVEELPLIRPGLLGRVLSLVERRVGKHIIGNARAVLGVTSEIAQYEIARAGCTGKPASVFPNTVVPESVELLPDLRRLGPVQACFMCGRFSPWHGLDLLINDLSKDAARFEGELTIHLIGNLGPELHARITALGSPVFKVHGHLDQPSYRAVLALCDVGIGSLALRRQGMTQGSTLKMCEMLAMGLPVYSGEPDVVIPEGFPYSHVDSSPGLRGITLFALQMRGVSRHAVREAAAPFVDKRVWLKRTAEFLRAVKSSDYPG